MKFRARLIVVLTFAFTVLMSYRIIDRSYQDPPGSATAWDNIDFVDPDPNNVDPNAQLAIREGRALEAHIERLNRASDPTLAEKQARIQQTVQRLLVKYDVNLDYKLKAGQSPWTLAESWVRPRQVHPEFAPEIGAILKALTTQPIMFADVGYRGTQLKLSLELSGGQRVAFKPKWYERDDVIEGNPYSGADRHNGEIAAFHLNRLLGYNRAPLVVGRTVDLRTDIMPVASPRLLNTFFFKNNNTCFYGKCLYCKSEKNGVCGSGSKMEGAVVLWLPLKFTLRLWKHPWSRTYKKNKKAKWEVDNNYCQQVAQADLFSSGPRLMDIVDASVFDYLIGNADRHHYETFKDLEHSMLVMLDSAKSFGNPYHDEKSILAPLYQCCKIRSGTWQKLQTLKEGVLGKVMSVILSRDPITPVLSKLHLKAMDRRVGQILDIVSECIKINSIQRVLVKDQWGPR